MKMTTEEIISDLRNYTMSSMRAAADRLEELQQALSRDEATVNQQLTVRPEPSRLEIAAMLLAYGWADRSLDGDFSLTVWALAEADTLIEAAKEVK